MLIRADPATKTISLLSLPARPRRPDLLPVTAAAARSGRPRPHQQRLRVLRRDGPLETVRHLTGLPINYLITVNFLGFIAIVNKLGGVWMDIDRRYYNKNVGTLDDQLREHRPPARLPAAERRAARSTSCASGTPTPTSSASRGSSSSSRAAGSRSAHSLGPTSSRRIVNTIAHHHYVEIGVGGGGSRPAARSLSYAKFALRPARRATSSR